MSSTLPWMSSTLPWISSTFPVAASDVPAGPCANPAAEPRPSASMVATLRIPRRHIGAASIGYRNVFEGDRNRRVIVHLLYVGRGGRIFGEPSECAAPGNRDLDAAGEG